MSASSASSAVRSGALSRYSPITRSPTGELRSMRSRRKATISGAIPAVAACGASLVCQRCRIVRRMTSGLLPARLPVS